MIDLIIDGGLLLATLAACAAVLVGERRRLRCRRERAELARHAALPPVPPEAWTGDTVRLAPYGAQPRPENEIAGRRWRDLTPVGRFREVPCRRRNDPLPDDLRHGRDRLRVIARRRPR